MNLFFFNIHVHARIHYDQTVWRRRDVHAHEEESDASTHGAHRPRLDVHRRDAQIDKEVSLKQ